MEANIKHHLRALIQLSIIDRDFGEPEKTYVYTIGKANRVPETEIDELVEEVLNSKENSEVNFQGLLTEERFDYLYDVIQLMKIDVKTEIDSVIVKNGWLVVVFLSLRSAGTV